jgi:hypothetical protein
LLTTPNHPEYPAAHGCLTSSDAEVYAKLLDTHRVEVDILGAVGGGTTLAVPQHYATVEQLDREIVNARVWAGLHFRAFVSESPPSAIRYRRRAAGRQPADQRGCTTLADSARRTTLAVWGTDPPPDKTESVY